MCHLRFPAPSSHPVPTHPILQSRHHPNLSAIMRPFSPLIFLIGTLTLAPIFAKEAQPVSLDDGWSGWGGNIYNNRFASQNTVISSKTATLVQNCRLEYSKGISATPVVSSKENIVYFPTWDGLFIALDYATCKEKWRLNVSEIITSFAPIPPNPSTIAISAPFPGSRTSPQIDGNVIYFGTQRWALLVAVDRASGRLLKIVQINPHPYAAITTSPTFYNGDIFIGAASLEEAAAGLAPNYTCCSFIGNAASLSFNHISQEFSVNWNISMIPEAETGPGKWSGSAIWGSQPSIDMQRNRVYFATGNTVNSLIFFV
jgi:hypothetical protein